MGKYKCSSLGHEHLVVYHPQPVLDVFPIGTSAAYLDMLGDALLEARTRAPIRVESRAESLMMLSTFRHL